MEASPLTELEAVRGMVRAACLSEEARHTAGWCLDSLAGPYADFHRTRDSRHGEGARRLVVGLLMVLPDAAVRQAVTDQLLAMHRRLGIPALKFALPKRKAG
jgi:hypothetical protein